MINVRTLAISALGLLLFSPPLHSQDHSRYRDFQLGATLASISALTGVAASEAKTIHVRPAMLQVLEWQRPYSVSGTAQAETDPVKQIVFSFYNDQLSRIVVDYNQERTAGMTGGDMIDAIAAEYGPQLKPGVRISRGPASQIEEESGTPVARWGDAGYSLLLFRSSYRSGYRIIMTSPRLEALARTADAEAIRLDDRDAPRREIARQKKETEDARASQEKARLTNKAAFRP